VSDLVSSGDEKGTLLTQSSSEERDRFGGKSACVHFDRKKKRSPELTSGRGKKRARPSKTVQLAGGVLVSGAEKKGKEIGSLLSPKQEKEGGGAVSSLGVAGEECLQRGGGVLPCTP